MPRTALPFVVEDGSGRTDATSYVSVETADTIMDRIPDIYRSAWLAADRFTKQQVLVWATQLFDDYVYFPQLSANYRNTRLSQFQALHFPRAGLQDYDGWVVNERSVPAFVQRAVTQLGFELLQTNRLTEPTRGIASASVGPLSVTFDSNYAHLTRVIPRSVRAIIAPYGGCVRGDGGIRSVPLYRS